MRLQALAMAALLLLTLVSLGGCDGEGLIFKSEIPSGGDQTGEGEGEGEPIEPDTTNLGTWIASYGDDFVADSASFGRIEYAARIALTRQSGNVTGQGVVYRVFSEGTVANDRIAVGLTGTISGSDVELTATSASGGRITDVPSWRLRISGDRMTGAYISTTTSGTVVRSGHTIWNKVSNGNPAGTWVTAFADDGGTAALPARARTGVMVLQPSGADEVIGAGSFVEQRPGDVNFEPDFNVIASEVDAPEFLFTLGELDLANNEMEWFSMFTSGAIVGSYAQFTSTNALARLGHAAWIYSPATTTPSSYTARWTTAFSDTGVAAGDIANDYLFSLQLTAGQNNVVTGQGVYITTAQTTNDYNNVRVDDAVVIGNHLQMTLFLAPNGERMTWDMRLGTQALVGSYQRTDGLGRFLSRGFAQWRRESGAPSTTGTWTGTWYDTTSVNVRRTTQFGLFTITNQANDGTLTGIGALRLGNGETGRRLFNLFGDIDVRDIAVTWRGPDLFGDTLWRFRQAGDNLFGIYQNLDSTGAVEGTGSAWWIKTSRSDSF